MIYLPENFSILLQKQHKYNPYIIIIMAEITQFDKSIMSQFEMLKRQYDRGLLEQNVTYTEENKKEIDLKITLQEFSHIVKGKLAELKQHRETVMNLTDYRNEITEIVKTMKTVHDNYTNIYTKNVLCCNDFCNDLKLECPLYGSSQQLLSGDLRGDKEISKDLHDKNFHLIKCGLYMINNNYLDSMYDICAKIDDKISEQTMKIESINDFIKIQKDTLHIFDIDKKQLSKYKCTICYDNEVQLCFMPCGHTFCKPCGDKVKKSCFFCNSKVTGKTPIYLLANDADFMDEVVEPNTGTDPVPYVPAPAVHI